ncbi:MAG: hypothetical protein V1707_03740 [bacterium]
MPWPKNLPGAISRQRLVGALRRLGFEIMMEGGKGSHCKAVWSVNQKMVVIPVQLPKHVLRYVVKEIETVSGIVPAKIEEEL